MSPHQSWLDKVAENPTHSQWFIERNRGFEREGRDLGGEARFIDALIPRQAHVLDAGCGVGRVAIRIARAGHDVVGVDIDLALIAAAREDYPGPRWLVGDLGDLNVIEVCGGRLFDAIACVGNVFPYIPPEQRTTALATFRTMLTPGGRVVIGFGSGRGMTRADLHRNCEEAGLRIDAEYATWQMAPYRHGSAWLACVASDAGRELEIPRDPDHCCDE